VLRQREYYAWRWCCARLTRSTVSLYPSLTPWQYNTLQGLTTVSQQLQNFPVTGCCRIIVKLTLVGCG
jgi:hypothetical protein